MLFMNIDNWLNVIAKQILIITLSKHVHKLIKIKLTLGAYFFQEAAH